MESASPSLCGAVRPTAQGRSGFGEVVAAARDMAEGIGFGVRA